MPTFLHIKKHNFNVAEKQKKYHGKTLKPMYKLLSGEIVIGEEVDHYNQLWYVVAGDPVKLIPAIGQQIVQNLVTLKRTVNKITVTFDKAGNEERTAESVIVNSEPPEKAKK
jgi:hypothetical protein